MAAEKPKKPAKPKKLNLNKRAAWRDILKHVEKKEIPVHVLEKLMVYLKDGTIVTIDIRKILSEGADPDDIQFHVNQRLDELDMYIDNVDHFIDIDSVERTVQPETDRILAKL